jgi:hypothetical protein
MSVAGNRDAWSLTSAERFWRGFPPPLCFTREQLLLLTMLLLGAQFGLRLLCLLWLAICVCGIAQAQDQTNDKPAEKVSSAANQNPEPQASAASPDGSDPGDILTVFPHSDTAPYWISGQANVILQWHPRFRAKYTGSNSLTPWPQSATTHILTLFTGYELTHTTEVFADVEYATGGGIGTALGLAGYTNLDSVRTVQGVALSRAPYLARLMLRQIIPLTGAH